MLLPTHWGFVGVFGIRVLSFTVHVVLLQRRREEGQTVWSLFSCGPFVLSFVLSVYVLLFVVVLSVSLFCPPPPPCPFLSSLFLHLTDNIPQTFSVLFFFSLTSRSCPHRSAGRDSFFFSNSSCFQCLIQATVLGAAELNLSDMMRCHGLNSFTLS